MEVVRINDDIKIVFTKPSEQAEYEGSIDPSQLLYCGEISKDIGHIWVVTSTFDNLTEEIDE
jgi:hypothetical protein